MATIRARLHKGVRVQANSSALRSTTVPAHADAWQRHSLRSETCAADGPLGEPGRRTLYLARHATRKRVVRDRQAQLTLGLLADGAGWQGMAYA